MQRVNWDSHRAERTGIAEAVYCPGKSAGVLIEILEHHLKAATSVLLTRLDRQVYDGFADSYKAQMEYHEQGNIAIFNKKDKALRDSEICIVTAGSSDLRLACEAQVTLKYYGYNTPVIADVGVAGLHRLLNRLDEIKKYKLVIAIAGMEGALFSVLAGLISAPVIALPSSVGYGVSENGQAALSSALSACAPGILTVNIDNAFGAATAAIKICQQFLQSE
ncbi:nickel pincer cofactor biosynthesis protein LarB [Gayadomonas joobiniege]|uniref:nickel pincer cofactor biosynthesis protein LarB n=1 Tax=Gayadomonas joobiniege TaxID=1234606 RepID=UPI00037E1B61|nr:nickel pincer cofactor biosynthesis protein LarB [Gayadomonas joobiniege]